MSLAVVGNASIVAGPAVKLAVKKTVMSGSMKPTLNEGDIIIVKYMHPGEIQNGDIIVFWAKSWGALDPGTPVVHRVTDIQYSDGYYYQTKGDNNAGYDPYTAHVNVIGKVIQTLPYLGILAYYVNTAGGVWLIYLLIGVTIIALIYLIIKEDNEEEEEKEISKN